MAQHQIQSVSGTTSASFIYDASGNTLYDGNNYYWYDAEGQLSTPRTKTCPWGPRLCAVQKAIGGTITQYVYDAEGARIGKGTLASAPSSYTATCAPPQASGTTLTSSAGLSLTARYLVDQGGEQVTEFDNGNWAHSNIWAGGKLTATYDIKGIHYELADPLGTKRVQANALGQVEETCTSLPFGNDVGNPIGANCTQPAGAPSTADDATEHHFTEKERDTETGNDYFFARYYTSALGRFTTPDWSAKTTPVPYAVFDDPQSLNLYAYVRNNPIIHVDLDGHGEPCGFWCEPVGVGQTDAEKRLNMTEEEQQKAQKQNGSSAATSLASFAGGDVLGVFGKAKKWFDRATTAEEEYSDAKDLARWKNVLKSAQRAHDRDTNQNYIGPQGDPDVDRAVMDLATANITYITTKMGVELNGLMSDSMATKMTEMLYPDLRPTVDAAWQRYGKARDAYTARLKQWWPSRQ